MTPRILKKSLLFIIAIILVLGLSVSFQSLLAAWTAPAANPPTCATGNPGCDAPLNAGPLIQPKSGALWLNTNDLSPYGLIVETGNVGIGTTGPLKKLHLRNAVGPTEIRLSADNYGTYWDINQDSAGLGFNYNGTGEKLKIDTSGNVGIGTTGPGQKLEVAGNIKVDGAIVAPEGTLRDDGGGWVRTYGNTGWYSQSYGGGWYMQDTTWIRTYGNKNIYQNTGIMRTDGTFQVGPSGNRFLVQTGGNVGIGTASPGAKLEVAGQVKITGGTPGAGKVLTSDAAGLASWSTTGTGGTGLSCITVSSTSWASCSSGRVMTGMTCKTWDGGIVWSGDSVRCNSNYDRTVYIRCCKVQ